MFCDKQNLTLQTGSAEFQTEPIFGENILDFMLSLFWNGIFIYLIIFIELKFWKMFSNNFFILFHLKLEKCTEIDVDSCMVVECETSKHCLHVCTVSVNGL